MESVNFSECDLTVFVWDALIALHVKWCYGCHIYNAVRSARGLQQHIECNFTVLKHSLLDGSIEVLQSQLMIHRMKHNFTYV
jgi:hypothetical protein